jgi:hypothetical protein
MNDAPIHTILSSFKPIGLSEMDSVRLMNRVETKYVFSSDKLPLFLQQLTATYKVLEIGGIRIFPYHTTYLDTTDLLFFTQQVRGKLNRHKVRYRKYESTGTTYLEIKKKTNKNRTIKWRIKNNSPTDYHNNEAKTFIKEYLPYDSLDLRPVLINGFTRITLVGEEFNERITLDINLSFAPPENENSGFPYLAIAELKSEKRSSQSPFGLVMKKNGIQPGSFSKYCIGSALVKDVPRKNNLKQKLLIINKIQDEYIKSTGS